MAAHGLPLAVKLLLVENRFYQLSDEDRIRCLAVDRLLHSTRWVDRRDVAEESPDTWTAIRSKIRQDLNWERAWEAVRKKHPDMFDGEDAPSGGFS